jgi:sugar O-acyltransferase (sialic acid O-acetyltransferase NeuD family)
VIEKIIYLGASGFPEVSEVVRRINAVELRYEIAGILDDDASYHGGEVEGVPVLGNLERVVDFPNARFIFGIGTHRSRLLRYEILQRLGVPAARYLTLIDPSAHVYKYADVGHGAIIHSGSTVLCGAKICNFSVVGWNAIVTKDVIIGEGAMTGPSVTILPNARLGAYSFVGGAASISEGVTIGPGAMVGACTFVHRDVSSGDFIVGTPPRLLASETVPNDILQVWRMEGG